MCGLDCSELMAVSSTLSKTGSEQTDLEGERAAWTMVMRETSRWADGDGVAVGLDVGLMLLGDICNIEDSIGILPDIVKKSWNG